MSREKRTKREEKDLNKFFGIFLVKMLQNNVWELNLAK